MKQVVQGKRVRSVGDANTFRPRVAMDARCKTTGKIMYLTEGRAQWAIEKFEERTGNAVRSHVCKCPDCGWFHLTRGGGYGQNRVVLDKE
jgi:hypothetical protein